MQKNFVFLSVVLVVLVVVTLANGCKVCGNPWCSAEDTHDCIELSIVEQSAKRHPWLHHEDSYDYGAPKCKHLSFDSHSGHGSGRCKGCSKDCCRECGGHRCQERDCKSSCPGDRGVKKLECKCKPKKSYPW